MFDLCNKHDIICIQEHRLLAHELNQLSCVQPNFVGFDLSAVIVEECVLRGRLYGGTGILYKKELAKSVNIIYSDNDRITAAKISAIGCEFILLPTYLLADYYDNDSYDNYVKVYSLLSLSYLPVIVTISVSLAISTVTRVHVFSH